MCNISEESDSGDQERIDDRSSNKKHGMIGIFKKCFARSSQFN